MAYTEPTAADLKARYPEFAAVDNATIDYWLTDAHRFVDQTWMEQDYGPALIARACVSMLDAEVPGITDSDMVSLLAKGVASFKSGTFQAEFSAEAIKQALAGGYEATKPGREYLMLLRRNKGGPGVTAPGVPVCGYGYRDGPFWPC